MSYKSSLFLCEVFPRVSPSRRFLLSQVTYVKYAMKYEKFEDKRPKELGAL
jgi:hypothetical protein